MDNITMYIDADKLGTDSEHPEVFARYCEERLSAAYPDADIEVTIGHGRDRMPKDLSAQDLWEDYCSLSRAEYVRLASAVPAARRASYLRILDAQS